MKLSVCSGTVAEKLLHDSHFRGQWKDLYDQCPWATVYQSVDLLTTWYATYRGRYRPFIVTGATENGELVGLLTLATSVESGELVVAGTYLAEYQVWVARPETGNDFIDAALYRLGEQFPNQVLQFYFLPPQSPLAWVEKDGRWRNRSILRRFQRGLMTIDDGSSFQQRLRKNRKFVNRLKKLGDLRLERLEDPKELESIFDELLDYTAFREKAAYGVDLERDPLKKAYHVKLMSMPGILYATILRANDKIVSARLDIFDRGHVSGGMLALSPLCARASPGSTHFMMLAAQLGQQGIHLYDLTPGGEYKERFATHHDEAYQLRIFFSRSHLIRYKIKRKLVEACKSFLRACKVSPERLYKILVSLTLALANSPLDLLAWLKREVWHTEELCLYACASDALRTLAPAPIAMKRDSISDLLLFREARHGQRSRYEFLQRAQELMESEMHFYTRVEDGRLTQAGWVIEQPHPPFSVEVEKHLNLPPETPIITDLYMSPPTSERETCHSVLAQMSRDVGLVASGKVVYISVSADEQSMREAIEAIGAIHQRSVFKRHVFGQVTQWSTAWG